MVLVRKCLNQYFTHIPVNYDNLVVLEMDGQLLSLSKPLIHIYCYIPPSDSPAYDDLPPGSPRGIELVEQCILDLYQSKQDFYLLIAGDLNARTGIRNSKLMYDALSTSGDSEFYVDRKSQDNVVNNFGTQLLSMCEACNCSILNGALTWQFDDSVTFISRQGASVIDLFILSNDLCSDSLLDKLYVDTSCVDTDHLPVVLHVASKSPQIDVGIPTEVWVEKLIWDKNKTNEFCKELQSPNIQQKLNEAKLEVLSNTSTALEILVDCLQRASACMLKRVKIGGQQKVIQKWFDKECVKNRRQTRTLLRAFKRTKDANERTQYVIARQQYKDLLRRKKQLYKALRAQSLSNSVNNPNVFWKELRLACGLVKKKTVGNNISLDQWREHFMKVFETNEQQNLAGVEDLLQQGLPSIDQLDRPILEDEVRKSIKKLKRGKSGGLDGVVPEMIKDAGDGIVVFLTALFNEVFRSGEYPEVWSKAIIVPIHKKGDTNAADNYRGISLLSTLGKCYTSILNSRLYSWLETNSKIHESQAGFRRGYTTSDHVFTLYSVTHKYLSKRGHKLYVAFIDLRKAFDSVSRNTLIGALCRAGVSLNFIRAIQAIYTSVMSCVRANNNISDMFECPKGLRQGCVLSPTLFSVIINEVAVRVSIQGRHGVQLVPGMIELLIMLFADDIALLSCSPIGLQNQLNLLHNMCQELDLNINTDKTKVMVFRHGGFLGRYERWHVDGQPLEVVNSYVYLGYKFTTTMSSVEAAKHLAGKGRRAVHNVLKAHSQLRQITTKSFFKMFDSMVQPVLSYCAELWGPLIDADKDPTEKIHLLACKRLLNVASRTPNRLVYGELGRYPLAIMHNVKAVKFWFRLLKMDISRLPSQAYQMLVTLDENGSVNWVTKVKLTLFQSGFGHVWVQQGVGDEKCFVILFKQRLVDMYRQDWNSALNDSARYDVYKMFKQGLYLEDYMDCVKILKFRDSLIRVRLGISNLRVHKNRYAKADQQPDNSCPFCPNAVDDEVHMLYGCSEYQQLRPNFLRNVPVYNQNMSFANIMSTSDAGKLRQLAWYLFKCLQRHDQ